MLGLSQPLLASAPKIPYQGEMKIIDGNSVMAYNSPLSAESWHYGLRSEPQSIFNRQLIREKYPEMEKLLTCIAHLESGYCKSLRGDNSLAWGCYQIHIDKHPISEWCAMDFECSLDYTAKLIKQGKGNLWTAFRYCI